MPVYIPINDTGPLKRTLIELAYGQCGIAGYEFGHSAEELADGLALLNAMMHEWPWSALGYNQPDGSPGDPAEPSGIPDAATSATFYELANRLAATKGVPLSREQQAGARRSYSMMTASIATVGQMRIAPNTPAGAGNRRRAAFIRDRAE